MASRLRDGYLDVFREYPFLLPLGIVTGAGQTAFALVNVYALPIYLNDLHVSGFAIGATSATFLLSETILKFPLGRWSDRVGRKPFIMLGPLVVCLNPIFFMALPARLWYLVFPLRVADGVGAAALWPPLFAVVGDLVKDRSRAAAMSVMNTIYVAAVGGGAIVGALSSYLTGSDRTPFYLAGGLLLASGVTAYLGVPTAPLPATEAAAAHDPDGATAYPSRQFVWGVLRAELARIKLLPYVLLISIVMSGGVLMLSNFLMLYLRIDMALTLPGLVLLIACLAVPVLILGLPLGHAADRWGTRNAVRLSLTVSALMMLLIPSCRTVSSLTPVATILVLSHILGTPAWLAVISQLAPTARRGGVMALVATGEGIGAGLGPLLGGRLWDIHHSWIFYGSAVLLSAAAALAFTVLPKLPSVTDDPPE